MFFYLLYFKQAIIKKVRLGTVLAVKSENSHMLNPATRHILWILLAFIIQPVHAQKKGYTRGYILTIEGETIEGWVKDRSSGTFMELYKQIRFKADDALTNRRYSPEEIQAYGIGDQHFESLPIYEESAFFKFRYYLQKNHKRSFLRLIARDMDLSFYHWEYIDDESNYLDYIPLFYREGSAEMVRVTQGVLGLKRKRLMEYFQDCPDLVLALHRKELHEIWDVYDFYLKTQTRQVPDNGPTGNRYPDR